MKVFYEDFVQYITGKRYIKAKGKSGYENRAVAGAKVHTKIFAHFQQICNGDEQKAEKKPYWYILVGLCTGADDQFELRRLATYKNYL